MDMSTSMTGLPWLDSPVKLRSSRADTCKLTPSQCEYRHGYWRYWYQADHVYGHATLYFMCAVIGVFAIGNIISIISRRSTSRMGNASLQKGLATGRFFSYRSFYLDSVKWYSLPIGVMLLGICGAIYFLALTLGPKPYYWPNTKKLFYGGSPPLATRSGWMAVALLPFVMILSSKLNYITYLTGISHEKLMVFHRWTSWVMFVLALVHTFPFIVVHIRKGDMMLQWKKSVVYWTGVAALIPQAYLNIMSLGVIRNRFYEFFKATHFLAVGFFVVFFFIHCDFRLTSWDYFIAALSLYGATYIFTFFRTAIQSLNAEAKFTLLPDSTIRISIPSKMSWKPGQHAFLRFWALPGLHSYSMHPFPICSLPASGEMVFFVRPHRGFTARLKKLVETRYETMAVSIDGPYGTSNTASKLASSDKALLIAGGSGAGYLLPLLESVLDDATSTAEVHVTVAVRRSTSSHWIIDEVERVLGSSGSNRKVQVDIHITDDVTSPVGENKPDEESGKTATDNSAPVVSGNGNIAVIYGQGRPDLKELVRRHTINVAEGTRVAVTSCGPASMGLDIGMRVRMLRREFLRGREEPERCGCIVRPLCGEVEVEFFSIKHREQ